MGEVGGEERDCEVSGGGDGLEEHRLGLGTLIGDGGGKIFQEEQRQLHLCLCCVCECVCICVCVCVWWVGVGGWGGEVGVSMHANPLSTITSNIFVLITNLLPKAVCFGSTPVSAAAAERSWWHPSQFCPAARNVHPTAGHSPATPARAGPACGREPGAP